MKICDIYRCSGMRARSGSTWACRRYVSHHHTYVTSSHICHIIIHTEREYMGMPQAYCIFSLGDQTYETAVMPKGWNPAFNSTVTLDFQVFFFWLFTPACICVLQLAFVFAFLFVLCLDPRLPGFCFWFFSYPKAGTLLSTPLSPS